MAMASTQHRLDNLRAPRVHITYDVEVGEGLQQRELPFVMGILADLAGKPKNPLPRIKDRKFVEIDGDNFNDFMASIGPRVLLRVDNKLTAGKTADKLGVELTFNSMEDFEPNSIINQVKLMRGLHETRIKLNDLLGKLDGNEDLDDLLGSILGDKKKAADIQKDVKDAKDGKTGGAADKALKQGKLIRDESQREHATGLLDEFIKHASKNTSDTTDSISFIQEKIQEIDELLSLQLDEILHDPEFQSLEGSWRGLHYLISETDTSAMLRIRVMCISKDELRKDLERTMGFDQTMLFKRVYEDEFGTFGGSPYSCLIGDYAFGRYPFEISLLEKIAQVASAAHAPFIASADASMFDLDSFTDLGVPRDLAKLFENTELARWSTFRDSEDSRYVALTMPRYLTRMPYGPTTNPVENLNYVENVDGTDNSKFCWGNASYCLAQRITRAAGLYRWTAMIRGVEGGGLVTGLPTYTFKTTNGDIALKCPTEVSITDRREKELSDQGFIALCHKKGSDSAVFFGTQTAQRPKKYLSNAANANANLSARLTYMMAASRFAHYIKVIMRDKIGSFMSRTDVSRFLNQWISQYVLVSDHASPAMKARFPLRQASVQVADVPGNPGAYRAVVFLRPHFQLEELTASIRLVANLPGGTY